MKQSVRYSKFVLLFFLFIVVAFSTMILSETGGEQDTHTEHVFGIDLSHFNGDVDWKQLGAGEVGSPAFIVLKATEGVDYLDPTFVEHWSAAKEHGFIRGAYHFFVAHDDPDAEADWYIKNVTLMKGDLLPIVDVERATKKETRGLKERLYHFLEKIEAHYGERPLIYTGKKFWDTHVGRVLPNHGLWIAQYGVDKPTLPSGWDEWAFWQFTQQAMIPGVEKPVDRNRFSGRREELEQLLLE